MRQISTLNVAGEVITAEQTCVVEGSSGDGRVPEPPRYAERANHPTVSPCTAIWQQAFMRCDVTVYYGVLDESAYQSIPTCNLNFRPSRPIKSSFFVCVLFLNRPRDGRDFVNTPAISREDSPD